MDLYNIGNLILKSELYGISGEDMPRISYSTISTKRN